MCWKCIHLLFLLVILIEKRTVNTDCSVQYEALRYIYMYPHEEILFIDGATSVVRSVLITSVSMHNLTAVMSCTAMSLFYLTTSLCHFLVLLHHVCGLTAGWATVIR